MDTGLLPVAFAYGLGEGKFSNNEKRMQIRIAAKAALIHRLRGFVSSCDKYRKPRHKPDNNMEIIAVMTLSHIIPNPAAIRYRMNRSRSAASA